MLLTARVLDVSCWDCVSIVLLLILPLSLTSTWTVGERAMSGTSSYILLVASKWICLFRCLLNITNITTIRTSNTVIKTTRPNKVAPTAMLQGAMVPRSVVLGSSSKEVVVGTADDVGAGFSL